MSPRVGPAALAVTGLLRPCWCQLATCFVWMSVEWTPVAREWGTGQEFAPHLLAAFTTLGNLAQLTEKGLGGLDMKGRRQGRLQADTTLPVYNVSLYLKCLVIHLSTYFLG